MSYTVKYTSQFKRDYKRLKRRGKDMSRLLDVIDLLREGAVLPSQYHDHPLQGNYTGHRDCHIEPDWVLIYRIEQAELLLVLSRTGSHSDLYL